MAAKDHFFDGDPFQGPCKECGEDYETRDERHDFGKVWWLTSEKGVNLRPYVLRDYLNEKALLENPTETE